MTSSLFRGTASIAVFLCALLLCPSQAFAQRTELQNTGFETGELGGRPEAWTFRGEDHASLTLVGEGVHEGKMAALLDASEAKRGAFSNVWRHSRNVARA